MAIINLHAFMRANVCRLSPTPFLVAIWTIALWTPILFPVFTLAAAAPQSGVDQQGTAGAAEFRQTTDLPVARQMHGAAVLGDYLYVLGGELAVSSWTPTVQKSHINPDGTLGPWSDTTPLPAPRAYIANATMALNDMLYVVGGSNETGKTLHYNTVLWSKPGPDGNLGPWTESIPFPGSGLSCLTAVSTPGFIHVLGGHTQEMKPTDAVMSGALGADGSLTSWEPGPSLPTPLWFHNSVALGGRVWVWGGLTEPEPKIVVSDRVYSSPILATGRLGAWREEPSRLTAPFYSAAMASAGPYLMSFCPRDSSASPQTDVWFTALTSQGLTPWQRATTILPVKMYIAAAPDYRRGTVYIPGGRMNPTESPDSLDKRVYYFQLSANTRKSAENQLIPDQPSPSLQASGSLSSEMASPTGNASVLTPTGPANSSSGAMGAASSSPTVSDAAAVSPRDIGPPSPTSQLTYLGQNQLPQGALPGFLPYAQARIQSGGSSPRPLLLYFNLSGARPCARQIQLLQDPKFKALTEKAVFSWLEIRQWPQLTEQLGIYRAPAWVLYDVRGNDRGHYFGVLNPAQLEAAISSAQ